MAKKGTNPTAMRPTSISSANPRARVADAPRSLAATTKSPVAGGNYKSPPRRPIKKAHVRFDDYLDLNEENMRRSCKRLMNRLYNEPTGDSQRAVSEASCSLSAAARSICSRPNSPPPLLVEVGAEERAASQSATMRSSLVADKNRTTAHRVGGHNVIASSVISELLPPSTEKSYLRSQYERRQQRQIELMLLQHQHQHQHQQQQESPQEQTMAKLNLTAGNGADARSCNQNDNNELTSEDAPGANNNICRQHQRRLQQEQQDLVAKSHELSKRRFFEQLERRESMKNSTQVSTQEERQTQLSSGARAFKQVQHPQPPAFDQRQEYQRMLPTKANAGEKENLPSQGEEEKLEIFQEPVKQQGLIASSGCGGTALAFKGDASRADASSDEQLMLKVYQSMVAAGADQPAQYCGGITVKAVAETQDTHDGAGSPPSKLPPAVATSLSSSVGDLLATDLIGLHTSTPQQQVLDKTLVAAAGKTLDESRKTQLGVTSVNEEHSLIEFSKGQQRHPRAKEMLCSRVSDTLLQTTSSAENAHCLHHDRGPHDISAFEIKVPPPEISDSNETMASSGLRLLSDKGAAQVQQVDDALATIVEEAVSGSGVSSSMHKVTSDSCAPEADAGTDADEPAASLETIIITNQREMRDVPPEANAGLLMLPTSDARSEATPLNHSDMQTNTQEFNHEPSIEVDREIQNERGRQAEAVGQVVALELRETGKVDQQGGCEDTRQLTERSLEAHRRLPLEDEHEQREQVLTGSKEQDQYANPSSIQPAPAQGNNVRNFRKNNVNHDRSTIQEALCPSQESARMQRSGNLEVNLISGRDFKSNQLIEPSGRTLARNRFNTVDQASGEKVYELTKDQRLVLSSSSMDPGAEEDIGSSCSSSGFGASVSATSSASSSDDRRAHHHKSYKDEKSNFGTQGHYRRPNSLAQSSQLYDTLQINTRNHDSAPLDARLKQVGPDQAYSNNRERPVPIESHEQISIVGRHRSGELPALPPHPPIGGLVTAKTKESALDLYSSVLYANLPLRTGMQRSPIVEYATVTARSSSGPANIPPAENKRYSASRVADARRHPGQCSTELPEPDDCESSLSAHNLSTSSANSGGFSMLPPVRLIDHNFANNSDFSKSLEPSSSIYGESTAGQQQEPKKSASLFKRFGSLVSRAFTSTSAATGGGVSSGSSGHLSNDCSTTPHSLSPETQSLSLHFNVQKLAASKAHERRVAAAFARREHKSGGTAKDSSGKNHATTQDALYSSRANAMQTTRADATSEKPLAMAEADLVILPTKHSKDNQQRKNDIYGGATLRHSHSHRNQDAEIPRERRAKQEEGTSARVNRSSRDVSERRASRRAVAAPLSPRSASISIISSYSSSSLDCSSLSELYGPTSLIDQSHANSDMRLDHSGRGKIKSRHYERLGREMGSAHETREPTSVLYASLQQARSLQMTNQPQRGSDWRKLADDDTSSDNEAAALERNDELVVNDGKCRSLNLYHNLMRNYVKRRHNRHNHHHHHHHHGNRSHHHHHNHGHHHNRHSSSTRHAHCSATTRCGQQQCSTVGKVCAGKNCSSLSEQSSAKNNCSVDKKTIGDSASVWGQLIKINKSDGSQVIELQRAPSRSWGFFVARGAINNMKGIFISRVHDDATGNSLNGLLGVGDRIISIDNCSIEPDDILRVNQMISKKNKILLRVKPDRG